MKQVSNPPNPFEHFSVEWLGQPPQTMPKVFEEQAKSILSRNESSDIPFRYELTRRCLELCLKYRNPVCIITKSALIQRDVDLLAQLAQVTDVKVYS